MMGRHPDNVAAALYGGFVATFLNELKPEDMARRDIPKSEIIPDNIPEEIDEKPSKPPSGIAHYRRLPFARAIKAVTIIPNFEVPDSNASTISSSLIFSSR